MSRRVEYDQTIGWVPTDEETVTYAEELSKWLKKSLVDDIWSEVEKAYDIEITDEMRQWIDENWDEIQHGLEKIEEDDMSEKIKVNPSSTEDEIDDTKKANERTLTPNDVTEMKKDFDEYEAEVNHPARYANYNLECINFIREILGDEGAMYFCLGNTIKYLWRRGKKTNAEDTAERDIQKGLWYFDKAKEIANGKLADEINAEIKSRS